VNENTPAAEPHKLKQATIMATEILGLLMEALRQEFSAGRWAAFEATKGFLEGPYGAWVSRAGAAAREAAEDDPAELTNRLRGAFLDLERVCRALMRLLQEEKRCRRDEVCAGAGLAPTQSHEENLTDLLDILRSIAPALSEPGLRQLLTLADAPEPAEDSRVAHPAARLSSLFLLDAGRRGASDIIAAPGPWVSLVQYRLGGILVPILEVSLSYHRALVGRFKAMAGLDISQHRRPQDGPAAEDGAGAEDSRRTIIRILPTVHGERVDIHLEAPPRIVALPQELGLLKSDLGRYEKLLASRSGLIIHAGLAHTGKRTALLAGLAAQAAQGRNAFAVFSAQPLNMPAVSVALVNPKSDHAALFKSVLERSPDVVAIDELTGTETMREVLQAACRGVLVLGALPCDSALQALRRLFDMELAADLVRQGLLGVCCHRLPRRLCACHKTSSARPEELTTLGAQSAAGKLDLGRPVGCPACLHTGFRGVAPVFELLSVGETLRPLLKPGVPDPDWLKAARADGMTPLAQSLVSLVRDGTTSLGEAVRWGLRAEGDLAV